MKIAETLSSVTKKLNQVDETIKQFGEIVMQSDIEDGNYQTPAIQNITGT